MDSEPVAEPIADRTDAAAVVADVDWPIEDVRARAPWDARARTPGREGPASTNSGWDAYTELVHPDDDVLPRQHFLNELARERRRADRSRRPASLVRFRLDASSGNEMLRMERLVELLRRLKRDSDRLGDLGSHTLAILLPDTGPSGVQSFIDRIEPRVAALNCSTSGGTYPDDLVDELVRGKGEDLSRTQPLFVDQPRRRAWPQRAIKRGIDLTIAAMALLALSPLMLATAATIAFTSPGPVIYRQSRIGRGGVPFVFYKFRSMVAAPDDRVHRDHVLSLITAGRDGGSSAGTRPWAKLKADNRITPVGQFIRKTSIDELPQLFNVLKGDLSLIGPRPPLPYEVEKYDSWHLRRVLEVKPGISGLWQVEAGYNATFDDMVRLDLRYIREQSLRLDLKILLKTVGVVVRATGAG
jgi:lipopolysaccharide/colanic/teichoic acid biosynthesis glycosyltransferase